MAMIDKLWLATRTKDKKDADTGGTSRSLKKLPIVMGIRPACHAVHRLGDVVVVGLGVSGSCRTYELG